MDTPSSVLHFPLDWQLLFAMGELSDLQDLSVSESPAQAQVMHYLQFIAGVVGQVWFVLSDSTPRKLLEGVAASGSQLNALAPALNTKVSLPSGSVTTAEGSSVYARVMPMGEDKGCWAVLVANGGGQPVANSAIVVTLPLVSSSLNAQHDVGSSPGQQLALGTPVATSRGSVSSAVTTAPFELNRVVNTSVATTNSSNGHIGSTVVSIAEPLLAFGTQVYLISQDGARGDNDVGCMWEIPAGCSKSSNLIGDNCGFERQHILGVPDNWLLTMVDVADPYAGGADPWASLNTDAAYARTGWFSVRYTSSKPHTSRLQSSNMLNIRANATYTLELWTSSPNRMSPVSLLVVSTDACSPFDL
jgi:hypothetical protein